MLLSLPQKLRPTEQKHSVGHTRPKRRSAASVSGTSRTIFTAILHLSDDGITCNMKEKIVTRSRPNEEEIYASG